MKLTKNQREVLELITEGGELSLVRYPNGRVFVSVESGCYVVPVSIGVVWELHSDELTKITKTEGPITRFDITSKGREVLDENS